MKPESSNSIAGRTFAGATWLGQFRFSHQFAKCRKDGTCQKMTDEKRASMLSSDREKYDRIWAFQKSAPEIYESGPLFCGRLPGICSSQHCRNVHWPNV
jgi:hypothetical protein